MVHLSLDGYVAGPLGDLGYFQQNDDNLAFVNTLTIGADAALSLTQARYLEAGVSIVVGFLFWPRGATAALGRALSAAFVASWRLAHTVKKLVWPSVHTFFSRSKYRAVTIWCNRFSVNFGTAPLSGSGM